MTGPRKLALATVLRERFEDRTARMPAGDPGLRALLDWLDDYDQELFGALERWDFLRAFIDEVTLTGASPERVAERAPDPDAAPRRGAGA